MVRPLLAALAFCALCSTASAAPFGASDTAFSGDGWLTLTGGRDYTAQANAVALQADRGIVSGGQAMVAGLTHFALTRHTPASGIDTGFGDQGKVVTPMGNSGSASITDVAVLGGGAILALGNARHANEPRIALARYTSTGTLDPGFGSGGKVIDALLADGATATTMAIAPDGGILVTGQIRDGATQKVFLRRFSASGAPEFLRTYTLGETGCATAARIFARPDTSIILIGGLCRPFPINGATYGPDGYVLKLTADGLRRGDFGTNGLVQSTIGEASFRGGIVDSQGRFVLLGNSRAQAFGSYFQTTAVGRLKADGTTDTSFGGGDGLATIASGDITAAFDADELADGRLWLTTSAVVGSAPVLGAWGFALLKGDGSPVTEFGSDGDGSLTAQIGSGQTVSAEAATESVVDTDGATQTVVAVGRASTTIYGGFLEENNTFGLRRFSLPKGQGVAPYNGYSGSATRVGQTVTANARRVLPQPDGGVFVAGDAIDDQVRRLAVWRLGADGSPVASWGTNGLAMPAVGILGARANDVVPATGGGYYAVGQATDDDYYDTLAVVKFTAAGVLDSGFSGDGILLQRLRPASGAGAAPVCAGTPALCRDDDGTAASGGEGLLAIGMTDGGVLVVGTAGLADSFRGGAASTRIVLARYTANGTPFPGFGTNGVVQIYRNGSPIHRAHATTLQGADRLLVAGVSGNAFHHGPIVELRFDIASGALDPTFSGDGYEEAAGEATYVRTGMRFAGGDSLVAAGYVSSPYPVTVARFSGVLSPLAGFGTGGFATVPATGTSALSASGVDLLGSGTLAAAVSVNDRSPRTASAIGVKPDGTLDTEFGSGGVLSTARSCGNFTTSDLAADGAGRLLIAGGGLDPALGFVASVARFVGGSPSAPIPCPPTTGSASVGGPAAGPLTCTPSSFNGATPLTYAYEWLRESTVIGGAAANSYALTAADAGHLLACRVRGSNAYGSYRVISNARRAPGAIVVEPEPTATPVATASPFPRPSPGPAPTPAPTATPAPKPLPALKPSAVFTLPSTKKCVSRRSFRIRLKAPRGVKLKSATVRVNGKLVKTVKGKRLTAPVDLRGLPKGRFTVKVEAKTTDGRTVRDTRKYRTCAPRGK